MGQSTQMVRKRAEPTKVEKKSMGIRTLYQRTE
jgi:hypothetical protein